MTAFWQRGVNQEMRMPLVSTMLWANSARKTSAVPPCLLAPAEHAQVRQARGDL